MANRTISLSPIGDLIRKKMIEKGNITFSSWVEAQLLTWNAKDRDEVQTILVEQPKVPWYYECQLCHQKGHHQSNCSMYQPGVEEE
jgi:hypothetical protein